MSIFDRWRSRFARDKMALAGVLAADPPLIAGGQPVRLEFGWGGGLGRVAGVLFAVAGFAFFIYVFGSIFDFGINTQTALLAVATLCFLLAAFLPDFTTINLAVTASGEGLRLAKLHRSYDIPWWQIVAMEASPDLRLVRIFGAGARIVFKADFIPYDRLMPFVQSIRSLSRPYGRDFTEWPLRSRVIRGAIPVGLSLVGGVLMLGVFAFFLSGSVIGIRCSSNSQFLQDTFGTPTDRQGCVVLRVSAGAEKAGMERGDLIVEMDDVPVTSGLQITKLLEDKPRPERRITVLRHGEELEFEVRPARRQTFGENPTDPFFYYLRARGEAGEEPDKALRDYTRVIELERRFDLAYLYRGQLLDEKGQFEAGLQDYLKALELSPNLGEVHRRLARNGQRQGSGAAHFDIRKAIELDRCEGAFERYNVDCAEDYYTLATLQDRFLDLNEPIENAKRAIRYWPRAVEAYYVLAVLYERIGDTATAADYARQYLGFPEDERYDTSERDAERIRDLVR
jgi:hypothetical protein